AGPRADPARADRQAREVAHPDRTAVSPGRGLPAVEARAESPARSAPHGAITLEAEHLAPLTPDQRTDLRLWHGRVNLLDRIRAARGYALFTAGMWFAAIGSMAGIGEFPPVV